MHIEAIEGVVSNINMYPIRHTVFFVIIIEVKRFFVANFGW
jgi:hypothetical protein